MSKSNARSAQGKAAIDKPVPPANSPLLAHGCGYWAKRIRGDLHYFGAWRKKVNGEYVYVSADAGYAAALKRYKQQADDLHAGRKPRAKNEGGVTVATLCDRFIVAKRDKRDAGQLAWRTWSSYKATTDRIVRVFGKKRPASDLRQDDFAALRKDIESKRKSMMARSTEIQRVRTVFAWAYKSELIDRPVKYGESFDKPDKTSLRRDRQAKGKRKLEPTELRTLIDAASPQLRAMLLLALNAGLGNTDCAGLHERHLDLDGGWLDYPRVKTALPRRAKLWPETVEAIRKVLASRQSPRDEADAGIVFLTRTRTRWIKFSAKGTPDDAIAKETRKLLDDTKLYRPGISFYAMRHIFRTEADATQDFPAVRLVMGHADSSIDDAYREGIEDRRLEAVAAHVHDWLFPPEKVEGDGKPKTKRRRKARAKQAETVDDQPRFRVVG